MALWLRVLVRLAEDQSSVPSLGHTLRASLSSSAGVGMGRTERRNKKTRRAFLPGGKDEVMKTAVGHRRWIKVQRVKLLSSKPGDLQVHRLTPCHGRREPVPEDCPLNSIVVGWCMYLWPSHSPGPVNKGLKN